MSVLEKRLIRVGESITESNPRCHCYREQAGHVLPIASEILSNVPRTLPIVFWDSIKRRGGSLPIRSSTTMRHRVAEQSIQSEKFSRKLSRPRNRLHCAIDVTNRQWFNCETMRSWSSSLGRCLHNSTRFSLLCPSIQFDSSEREKKSSANCVSCNLKRVCFLIITTSFTRFKLERGRSMVEFRVFCFHSFGLLRNKTGTSKHRSHCWVSCLILFHRCHVAIRSSGDLSETFVRFLGQWFMRTRGLRNLYVRVL